MHQWVNEIESERALPELLPPLTDHKAIVEANRCLFCYDAPCTHACPTHIDIPRFIKKIVSGNMPGSARTILDSNLLGATCARVCPVQELCEGACVLGSEHKPIMIGRLQRHAMDFAYQHGVRPMLSKGAQQGGGKIAVIGAGPAGLSCAGELARRGHKVTVFEKRELAGGLSTYGIIGLREPASVALAEVELIRSLGVAFRYGVELCRNLNFTDLLGDFEAVFLSGGLGRTPALNIDGEEHVVDGLRYIEGSKLNPRTLEVGRRVVVVGAGNTAVDCATVAKRLGAEEVTIVYRRSEREVSAYPHEVEFIRNEGVQFQFLTQPEKVFVADRRVTGLQCVRVELGRLDSTRRPAPVPVAGSQFVIAADQVVKAIGQERPALAQALGLKTDGRFIAVDSEYATSIPRVFAGGDCIRAQGTCSTVMAVQDGKLAAQSIHRRFKAASLQEVI